MNKENNLLCKYKLEIANNNYNVILNKKVSTILTELENKDLILSYTQLFPYLFLKFTNLYKVKSPTIIEINKDSEWQISFAN